MKTIFLAITILVSLSSCYSEKSTSNLIDDSKNEDSNRFEVHVNPIEILKDSEKIFRSFSIEMISAGERQNTEIIGELEDGFFFDPRSEFGKVTLYNFNTEYEKTDDWSGKKFWGCSVEIEVNSKDGKPQRLYLTPYFSGGDYEGETLEFTWKDFGEISRFFRYATTVP